MIHVFITCLELFMYLKSLLSVQFFSWNHLLLVNAIEMSGNNDVSDIYATVDKSNKITCTNNKYESHHLQQESQDSESAIPMHAAAVDETRMTQECGELEDGKMESIEVYSSSNSSTRDQDSTPDSKNLVNASKTFAVSQLALILSVVAIALLISVIIVLIMVFSKVSALESSENSNSISTIDNKLQNLNETLTESFNKLIKSNISMIGAKVQNLNKTLTLFYEFQQQTCINGVLNI